MRIVARAQQASETSMQLLYKEDKMNLVKKETAHSTFENSQADLCVEKLIFLLEASEGGDITRKTNETPHFQ
jgi:hypothetical protein